MQHFFKSSMRRWALLAPWLVACGDPVAIPPDAGTDAGSVVSDAGPACTATATGAPIPELSDIEGVDCALSAFDGLLEPARVICLGENDHGVAQSWELAAQATRRWVVSHGVRTIVLEASHASATAVSQFVASGDETILDAHYARLVRTLADSVESRAYFRSLFGLARELDIVLRVDGLDVAVSTAATVLAIRAFLEQTSLDASPWARCLRTPGLPSDLSAAHDECESLRAELTSRAAELEGATSEEALRDALRNVDDLSIGYQFLIHYVTGDYGAGSAYREPAMARNLLDMHARLPEGERMLVLAHAGHCGRGSPIGETESGVRVLSFGTELGATLGTAYLPIGEVYGAGEHRVATGSVAYPMEVGSLEEAFLARVEGPGLAIATSSTMFGFDFASPAWSVWWPRYDVFSPRERFDALVFLRDVTATHAN